jgi:hypothetical protein
MPDVLVGWKEISTYLRVSEKTALRYCERGLPVVRDPAGHPVIEKKRADEWRFIIDNPDFKV